MCQDSSQIFAPQRRKYRLHITKIQKHKYTVHITKFQNTSAQFYITKLHKYTSAESPVGKGNLDVNVSRLLPDQRSSKTLTHYKRHKYTNTQYTLHKYTVYITKLHKYTSAESPVGKGNLDVNVSSLLPDRRSLKTEETTLTDVLPRCISTFTINAQI